MTTASVRPSAPVTSRDSGADPSTRERVVRSVLSEGPSSATDLASRLALTPAAVRRHLDQLLEEGLVEAREPRATASRGRGRPAKVFALTAAGRDRLDQAYDDLAVQAIRFLAETGGSEAVRRFAERRAAGIEERFEDLVGREPELERSQALAQVLTQDGYAAAVRDVPVGEQLCQQHCPVSHVAHEFPELCEAETAAIGRMLGRHVQRLATIAHGDGVCTTCIPDPVPAAREQQHPQQHPQDHPTHVNQERVTR